MSNENKGFPPKAGLKLPVGITILPLGALKNGWGSNKLFDRSLRFGHAMFCVVIHSDGFVADVIRAFGLDSRLLNIHQLQCLSPFHLEYSPVKVWGEHIFPHTRLAPHSIAAAVYVALMYYLQGKSTHEMRVAVLSTLIHDCETPAGGDAMKAVNSPYVNHALFDEDEHCPNAFKRYPDRWKKLKEKYFLPTETPEIAAEIIRARGLGGQIHKIADTLSYVMTDLAEMQRIHQRHGLSYAHHHQIHALARADIFNVWQHVQVVDGVAVIDDHRIAHDFIKLHLELWVRMYTEPGHKGIELLMTQVVYPWLFQIRQIDPSLLLRWHDGNLQRCVKEVFGLRTLGRRLDALGNWPRLYRYSSLQEAWSRQEQFTASGHLAIPAGTPHSPLAASRTRKFYVLDKSRKPVKFADAYPRETEEMERQARQVHESGGNCLVVYPSPRRTTTLHNACEEAQRRWRQQRK